MKLYFLIFFTAFGLLCNGQGALPNKHPFVVVLGTLQDGGSPHMGCEKECCRKQDASRKVVSLGLIDPVSNKKFLLEASPDFVSQTRMLKALLPSSTNKLPDGIFLTHAHIGHYAGLMFLGKEAMNSKAVPVYAMPKMKSFLENNGPWSQLVGMINIKLSLLDSLRPTRISESLTILPLIVPHRDEFSETVGFLINGPNKKLLFIPDIDKWEKWRTDIVSLIKEVDYALIDGTFFSAAEVGNRNITEIPHPLVQESMNIFSRLNATERKKIIFIHFNHTNPLLNKESSEAKLVKSKGFRIVDINFRISL